MLTRAWSPSRWGLSARIVALSLLLLLLVQAAVYSVVRISIEQSARRQVSQELQVGERVWRRLLDQNAEQLRLGAGLLAADFGFRSAVNTGDIDTIRSALENNGARIGASVTALMDTQLVLRAPGGADGAAELAPVLDALVKNLSHDTQGSQVALVGGVPHQFVMVPMKAPVLVGYVLMGFPINQKLLDDMRAISDMHLVLFADDGRAPGRVVASTLSPEALAALQAGGGDVQELAGHGDTLIARSVKLDTGTTGSVRTVLLRSLSEVVAPFRQAQIALAWITALGVVLFGIGSVFAARRVTTPLRALVGATQRVGQGQYDVPIEHLDRHDEIGGLANAFDQMRISIGAQQAEIRTLAYRDRLTGLPNRARFREALQQAIDNRGALAEAQCGNIAVVMLDIDRFKHVNDVLGYAFGDLLLVAVAKRLTEQELRAGDMVARLGGDEFAILLALSDVPAALGVATRIAKSFELPLTFDDQTVDLSAGIGVACWPMHAQDADTLLSRAEVAMYAAKSRTTGIQGYFLSRPMPAQELSAWCARWQAEVAACA